MRSIYRYGYWYEIDFRSAQFPPYYWDQWERLEGIAPLLREMLPYPPHGGRVVPYLTSDDTFLALAACFAHPERREILTRLVFDLMYEDLRKLFVSHCERMHGWQPQKAKRSS